MYESEYRKALRDAGFGKFRVLIFQESGGLNQSSEDAALELNAKFGFAMLRAMVLGDLVNDLGYKIRPYEKKRVRPTRS